MADIDLVDVTVHIDEDLDRGGRESLIEKVREEEGVARAMLRKLGVSPNAVVQELSLALDRLPKVSGAGDVFLSPDSKTVLDAAFKEATKMKDEYISIEHIFLAITDQTDGEAGKILSKNELTWRWRFSSSLPR